MEKTNIRRLVGVMMPFMIMVIVQRLGLLVFGMAGLPDVLRDTFAFVTASAAGIFFFRMSCGADALRIAVPAVPESGDGGGNGADGGDDRHVPPFRKKDTRFGRTMYTLVCIGALVIAMHVVAMAADAQVVEKFAAGTMAAEFVSLVLIHPFLEEYVFRWLYYRELRPMHPIFAGLAQAVMFAIVHGSVGGMVYALFAGVLLVVAMERSGSLAAAVISHMLVNLRSFVYLTWLADGAVEQAEQVRMMIDFGLVSLGFGAFLGLMVRRSLREVWNAADADADAESEDGSDDTGTE